MNKTMTCLILLITFSMLFAGQGEPDIKFDRLTATDGLPDNVIRTIYQDRAGFIWVGSNSGLVRYDGYEFRPLPNLPDTLRFVAEKAAGHLLEDGSGNLWIGTVRDGLYRYNFYNEILQKVPIQRNDSTLKYNHLILSLYLDSEQILWIGTGSGLNRLNIANGDIKIFQRDTLDPATLGSNIVNAITEDRQNRLWIATNYGIHRFNRETETFARYTTGEWNRGYNGNLFNAMIIDKQGFFWLGAYRYGLRRFDPETRQFKDFRVHPDQADFLSSREISKMLADQDNIIWIGTPGGGLMRFDPQTGKSRTFKYNSDDPYSVVSDFIFPHMQDNTGIIWFGTAMSGICKLDPFNHKFKHITRQPHRKNTLSSNRILSMIVDSHNHLWVGTDGRGLDKFNHETGRWQNYISGAQPAEGINLEYVLHVFEDRNHTIWCGTDGAGLYRYDRSKNRFVKYQIGKYRYQNRVDDMFEDSAGNFWLCCSGDGLKKFDRQTGEYQVWYHRPEDSTSISSSYVYGVVEDKKGMLWIVTRDGLNRMDMQTEKFKVFRRDKGLSSHMSNIMIDRRDRIWVSVIREGLFLFDPAAGTFTRYQNSGAPQLNKIKGILEDNNGNLWMGNDLGIAKFDPVRRVFFNYGEKDGLLKGLINESAFAQDADGNLYFGGNYGISYFNPEEIIDNTIPPAVCITAIQFWEKNKNTSDRKNITFLDTIELEHRQNDITFEFAALQFSRPGKNRYACKLENFMDDFRYIGEDHTIDFTNLSPGDYRFIVQAANSDGYWNETGKSLTIIIHPPFWETGWFRIMVLLLIGSGIYAWHHRRVQKLERRKRELEERVQERTAAAEALNRALAQVESLKDRLQAENTYLKDEINLDHNFSELISRSEKIKKVLLRVEQVSATDSTVLILGESGTGKELIARAIHNLSRRRERPLVKVNCAALPANLVESELFGHEKGAFTGALARKSGKFELAHGGTIFLDEIGELPLELQSKLLRVLQEKEFEPIGSHKTQQTDVRIIAATNRELQKEVENGRFREDLFFRLNVFPVIIPPLRDRKEDIALLVPHFVEKYSTRIGKPIDKIPKSVIDDLMKYHWPGNVRELENVIERAVIISPGSKLVMDEQMIRLHNRSEGEKTIVPLEENERNHILKALKQTGGRVSGEKGAARLLHINPQTLVSRMKKLGIDPPAKRN